VERTCELLATPPLGPRTALVIDKTGVGAAVLDMFTAAGLRPYGVTITGGDRVVHEDSRHAKVPKRDLVGLLVALFQSGQLKVARDLELAPLLLNELLNFKLKVNVQTAHESYEAWRESIHDDLVLAVALACWQADQAPALPFGWYRRDASLVAGVLGDTEAAHAQEEAERRRARMPMTWNDRSVHRVGARMAGRSGSVPGTSAAHTGTIWTHGDPCCRSDSSRALQTVWATPSLVT
jgi:hypothetical protein